MMKQKKIKIKYVCLEPKTPEEKEQQQRILDHVYDDIFERALKDK